MRLPTILILCLFSTFSIGQDHGAEGSPTLADSVSQSGERAQHIENADHEEHAHHMIQIVIGHTHIFEGRDAGGDKKWLILPTWGLNYNYKFDERWEIGLHTDMIVETFEVERGQDEVIIERTTPASIALMGGFKTSSPFTLLLGGGIEFEKEANLGFMRIGVEPAWPFGQEQWEVSVVLSYDIRFQNYDSWLIGFGIARLF